MNRSRAQQGHLSDPASLHSFSAQHSLSHGVNRLGAESQTNFLVWFVLLHVPLAVLFYQGPGLSIVWGYIVIAIGVVTVLLGDKGSLIPLYVLAYLGGGEMMWRLLYVAPAIPHEVGKYGFILIASIGTIRRYRRIRDWPPIPFLFLICLLPSMLLWIGDKDLAFARKAIIGTLGAPIALAVGAMYVKDRRFDQATIARLALIVVAPIVSVVTIASYNTWIQDTKGLLYFGRSSNLAAAGGRGPNQVSNTLALGALFCWLTVVHLQVSRFMRFVMVGIAIWMVAQALLTFSRGGVVALALSVAASMLASISTARGRATFPLRNFVWFALIVLIVTLAIWPWLDRFTSGRLTERYDAVQADTSGRTEIAMAEIEMWKSSLIFGIGVGKVREEIEAYLPVGAYSHTEFTRLLAEHGVFGLFAIILFLAGLWHNFVRAKDVRARSWVAGLGVFAILYMSQAATRTTAPVIAYMLTWAILFAPSQDEGVLVDQPVYPQFAH